MKVDSGKCGGTPAVHVKTIFVCFVCDEATLFEPKCLESKYMDMVKSKGNAFIKASWQNKRSTAPFLSPVPTHHEIERDTPNIPGVWGVSEQSGQKGCLNVHLIWSTLMQSFVFICIHYNWNLPRVNGFTLTYTALPNMYQYSC